MPVVPSLSGPGLVGLGQGLNQASSALFQIAMREDRVTLKKAEVALAERLRDLQYGNPELGIEGYNGTQNDVAVDGLIPARQTVASAVETLKQGLPSRLHDRFDIIAAGRVDPVLRRYSEHALTQQRATETAVSEARLDSAIQDGIADPANLSRSMAIIASEVSGMFTGRGVTDDIVIQQGIEDAQTQVLSGAFNAALAKGDHGAAKEVLDNYGAQMEPSAFLKAELNLAKSVEVEEIQRVVQEISALNLTEVEKRREVARRYTGDMFNKVMAAFHNHQQIIASAENVDNRRNDRIEQLRQQMVAAGQAEQQAQENAIVMEMTEDLVSKVSDPVERRRLANQLEEMHPDKFNRNMELEVLKGLDGLEKQQVAAEKRSTEQAISEAAPHAAGGNLPQFLAANPVIAEALKRDPSAWSRLRGMQDAAVKDQAFAPISDGKTLVFLANLSPSELAGVEPTQYRHLLTEQEFGQFQSLRLSAQKAGNPDDPNYPVFTRGHKMLVDYLPNDIKTGARASRADKQFLFRAENRMNGLLQEFLDGNGRRPTEQELRTIAAQGVMEARQEVRVPGGGLFGLFDATGPAGEFTDEEIRDATIDIDDIPPRYTQIISGAVQLGSRYSSINQVPRAVLERVAALLYHGTLESKQEAAALLQ